MNSNPLQFLEDYANGTERTRRCKMVTQNGFGARYLGVGARDDQGCCFATKWVVVAGLPLWPISRDRIHPRGFFTVVVSKFPFLWSEQFTFDICESTPLRPRELVRTLVFFWLLFPLLIVSVPLAMQYLSTNATKELQTVSATLGLSRGQTNIALTLVSLVWVFGWWWIVRRRRANQLLGPNQQQSFDFSDIDD